MSDTSASKPDAGSKRAAEMSEAMMGIPEYADDSMLFLMRYGDRCKRVLCKADFDELMATLKAMSKCAADDDAEAGADGDAAEARAVKVAELRAKALSTVSEHPDLVRDFDRFRAVSQAVTRQQPKFKRF